MQQAPSYYEKILAVSNSLVYVNTIFDDECIS